ncbi:unnamed protein product [Caenorhabditis brenneri]
MAPIGEMSFSQWKARQSQLNVPPQLPEKWIVFQGFIAFRISENVFLVHCNNRATTYTDFDRSFYEGTPVFREESLCRCFTCKCELDSSKNM